MYAASGDQRRGKGQEEVSLQCTLMSATLVVWQTLHTQNQRQVDGGREGDMTFKRALQYVCDVWSDMCPSIQWSLHNPDTLVPPNFS